MKSTGALIVGILIFALPVPADASGNVKYKNQKAGQFCKAADIGKITISPTSGKLKCLIKKGSNRARWSN